MLGSSKGSITSMGLSTEVMTIMHHGIMEPPQVIKFKRELPSMHSETEGKHRPGDIDGLLD